MATLFGTVTSGGLQLGWGRPFIKSLPIWHGGGPSKNKNPFPKSPFFKIRRRNQQTFIFTEQKNSPFPPPFFFHAENLCACIDRDYLHFFNFHFFGEFFSLFRPLFLRYLSTKEACLSLFPLFVYSHTEGVKTKMYFGISKL